MGDSAVERPASTPTATASTAHPPYAPTLFNVAEGRLGLSASTLTPEQRKTLASDVSSWVSNTSTGFKSRARNTPLFQPDRQVAIFTDKEVMRAILHGTRAQTLQGNIVSATRKITSSKSVRLSCQIYRITLLTRLCYSVKSPSLLYSQQTTSSLSLQLKPSSMSTEVEQLHSTFPTVRN